MQIAQPTLLDTAGASHLCHERKYLHARKAGASYDLARKLTVGKTSAARWESAMRFSPLAFIAQTALTILLSQGITANADEIKSPEHARGYGSVERARPSV